MSTVSTITTSNAGTLSAVDLSKLPFPEFLVEQDYESVLAQMLTDVSDFCQAKTGQRYIAHEADPAYIIIEACAYRRWTDIKDYQTQVKNMLVAYASGAWLDHLGANSEFKCERLTIVPADPTSTPPTDAVMESDDAYRARLVLTNESYTTAGSSGAYLYHALSADGDVRDVSVQSPLPGQVLVTILSHSGGGIATQVLIDLVQTTLSADTVRPLCDQVIVQPATVKTFSVALQINTYPNIDIPDALARATASIHAYTVDHNRLGHDITIAAITAAAMVSGVQNVSITTPATDLIADDATAHKCTDVTVTHGEVAL